MNANSLFALTTEAAQIEDMLWESGGEITPEIEERMNDNAVALRTKTDSYGALIHKFGSTVDMIDAEIKRLTAHKKVAQNAETKLKDRVKYSMEQNGMTKLDGAFTKFSLRKSEKTITDDESILAPYQFVLEEFRQTLPPYITLPDFKVNKTIIKDMIKKDGIQIPGAHLEENMSLIVK